MSIAHSLYQILKYRLYSALALFDKVQLLPHTHGETPHKIMLFCKFQFILKIHIFIFVQRFELRKRKQIIIKQITLTKLAIRWFLI